MSKNEISIELIKNIIVGNLIVMKAFQDLDQTNIYIKKLLKAARQNHKTLKNLLKMIKKTPPDCNGGESIN